jgi:hypothetical protein
LITKTDCLSLLFELKDKGMDCTEQIKHLLVLPEPDIETIKFINDNRELNVRKFYEKLRKSYNQKRSNLYINIVRENRDKIDPKELVITLASLQLQILLFNKTLDDIDFLRNARFDEISKVLLNYYSTRDIIPCQRLLDLVKSDLKVLEEISKE